MANVFAQALKTTTAITFAVLIITFVSVFADAEGAATQTRENVAGDDTPTIFDVRKSLPMEPSDPTFHDFYINAGAEAGFKKGQYLPVSRAIPVHDPVQNKQQGILTVPVGKVLVIHVERNMTVARLASELGDDERPTLEYEAIMIGDKIDMKGISMEAPKNTGKKKKRTTAADETPVSLPAAPAAAVVHVEVEKAEAPAKTADAAPAPAAAVKSNPANETTSQPRPASAPQRVTQPVPPPTA